MASNNNLQLKEDNIFSIAIVIGTRPEAIKLSPLILEFKKYKNIEINILLTGQHKEMVTQVLEIFNIKENINLNIMKHNQTLIYLTTSILSGLEDFFAKKKINLVVVQGDTTSAFAASLVAFYFGIKVAHVEAGLRTNELDNPFPEEANRRMITQLASFHFAPTEKAIENLKSSSASGIIKKTGNTVIDALMIIKNRISNTKKFALPNSEKLIFASIHRRENWGVKIESIADGLNMITEKYANIKIIIPMHKNQNVRKSIKKVLDNNPKVELLEPLNYIDLVSTLMKSYIVLTDSGGIQEEAPSLGKPVLILRETTERSEAIEAGTAILVGTNAEDIFNSACQLIDDKELYEKMSKAINPYGDGKASQKIVNTLFESLHIDFLSNKF